MNYKYIPNFCFVGPPDWLRIAFPNDSEKELQKKYISFQIANYERIKMCNELQYSKLSKWGLIKKIKRS